VVVVELGTVLCSVVVVVLGVGVSFVSFTVVQPDSDAMATAARNGIISFFISIIVVWFVTLQYEYEKYAIGWS